MSDNYDFLFKIVLIGDSDVGKSNLLSRFVRNEFDYSSIATLGVEFATKTLLIDGKLVKTQIWDTSGQERYRAITNAYYRGSFGAIIVFNITDRSSFESVGNWLKEVKTFLQDKPIITLVGNKVDLEHARSIFSEEIDFFCQTHKIQYFETSALTGQNVNSMFENTIETIYRETENKIHRLESVNKDIKGGKEKMIPYEIVDIENKVEKKEKEGGCCCIC